MAAEYPVRKIINYFSITDMSGVMAIVIENAKQTLDRSSAHSSKYNKKQTKFNYCLNLHAYSGNVIIGFLVLTLFFDIWEN